MFVVFQVCVGGGGEGPDHLRPPLDPRMYCTSTFVKTPTTCYGKGWCYNEIGEIMNDALMKMGYYSDETSRNRQTYVESYGK